MLTGLLEGGLHITDGPDATKHAGDGVGINCGDIRNGRCGPVLNERPVNRKVLMAVITAQSKTHAV